MLEMFIFQPFQEFYLITPISITGTFFDTKLSRFSLAGSLISAVLDFSMLILNLEIMLITSKHNIT